jgi:elongation factor G
MLSYASVLKSITSDQGTYQMEFDHYEAVPAPIQDQIVQQAAKAREAQA